MQFKEPIPLALYIHIPWCVRKCPYCDFNSHQMKTDLPEMAYIDRLIVDLEQSLPLIWGRRLISIFIGGGTPSLFSAASIETLLNSINTRLPFSRQMEITLEANPGTVEVKRFADYRHVGINRLSLGVQSFEDKKLASLGRIHDGQTAIQAIDTAKKAGFTNFNIDLMHGLPQQTVAEAQTDLQIALALEPTHLSWYQLTLEPNTLFYQQPPTLPPDDLIWDMQEAGYEQLTAAGYQRYEVSAYCQPNWQCQHNLNYWQFGDYLGIGAGAHSKITNFQQQTVIRMWKVKNPRDYLNSERSLIGECKNIASQEMPFEFMLNALRLEQSIAVSLLEARSGLGLNNFIPYLEQARAKGFLEWDQDQITLTQHGKQFINDAVSIFLFDDTQSSWILG